LLFENGWPSAKITFAAVAISLLAFLFGHFVFRRFHYRFAEEL
jgi:ABC-type polysaccharide/polyol phosphate export permease